MSHTIRYRIILPLALGLIILLTSFTYTAYHYQTEHIDEAVLGLVNTTVEQLNREIDKDTELISGLLDFVEKDEKLRQVWLAGDRERLLEISLPIFEHIRSQYRVTHFYFHTIDQINFLRVHNPGRHGDIIKRFTMRDAAATGETKHGIELGPMGTFTLRVVRPWLINGELVGYLELGEEIEHVVRRMQATLKLDYVLFINKKYIDRKKWSTGLQMMNRVENWEEYDPVAIIFRTLKIPAEVIKPPLAQHIAGKKNILFSSEIDGQRFRSGFAPLTDVGNRHVGDIIVFYNVTEETHSLNNKIQQLLLITILPSVLLWMFFWLYLGRIERQLISSHDNLVAEQNKREATLQQLQASEHKYRSIIENLQDVYYRTDLNQKLTLISPSGLQLFGYQSEEEMVGRDLNNFFENPDDLAGLLESIRKTDQRITGHELKLIRKDTTAFPVTVNSAVYLDQEGKVAGIEGIFSDITERQKLETELGQARKLEAVGQLAAGIAHEINTPAQFVSNNIDFFNESQEDILKLVDHYQNLVDMAQNRPLSAEEIKAIDELVDEVDWEYLKEEIPKAVEQSQNGVNRITKIVRAMKEFSHPGTKEKAPNNINKIIETTVTVASNEWKHVAELQLELAPDLPMVDCLAGEIGQVFLNIIVNAAHAIADRGSDTIKGSIKIGSTLMDDWVEIRVEDNGGGIPASIKDHIFDPFFTTKDVGKGTGQGLAIAYDVVTVKHGGQLTFETVEEQGTTFIIRLPVGTQEAII